MGQGDEAVFPSRPLARPPAAPPLPLGEKISGRIASQAGDSSSLFWDGHLGCGCSLSPAGLALSRLCPFGLNAWTLQRREIIFKLRPSSGPRDFRKLTLCN